MQYFVKISTFFIILFLMSGCGDTKKSESNTQIVNTTEDINQSTQENIVLKIEDTNNTELSIEELNTTTSLVNQEENKEQVQVEIEDKKIEIQNTQPNKKEQKIEDNNTQIPEIVVITEIKERTFTINSGENFKIEYNIEKGIQPSLINAPIGMNIFPNGTLTWTPTSDQRDDYNVTVILDDQNGSLNQEQILLHIEDINLTYDGVFIDPTGTEDNEEDGTPLHPFSTYKDACSHLDGKTNLYIRGGTYYNPDFSQNLQSPTRYPSITGCQGSASKPLTLKPWGNERVKIVTDALYGMKIKADVKYFIVDGFEIEGVSKELTQEDIVNQWWDEGDTIKGSGISINGSYITIKNNVVHHMPGSGISASSATYVTIEDNIVYDCDWWTIAGSHGIGITQALEDEDNNSTEEFYNKIQNNLIFGVEQRMMSRVWAKGFATLEIDEGEAFLIQEGTTLDDSETSYSGRYLIENNIIAYNGKTGVINLAKNTTIQKNSYYLNGTTTDQAGFRINKSDDIVLENNAIVAAKDKTIYSVGGDYIPYLEANFVEGGENDDLPDGMEIVEENIFENPDNFNFQLSSSLPQDIGASQDIVKRLRDKLDLYKITVEATHYVVDKVALTKAIVEARPEGSTVDDSHYDDDKPYLIIQNLPEGHPAGDEMILYTPYKEDSE
jgi:hypothetical protein